MILQRVIRRTLNTLPITSVDVERRFLSTKTYRRTAGVHLYLKT